MFCDEIIPAKWYYRYTKGMKMWYCMMCDKFLEPEKVTFKEEHDDEDCMAGVISIDEAAAEPFRRWIPVDVELPDMGRNIEVFMPDDSFAYGEFMPTFDGSEKGMFRIDGNNYYYWLLSDGVVTHWRYEPEPPMDERNEDAQD